MDQIVTNLDKEIDKNMKDCNEKIMKNCSPPHNKRVKFDS